MGALWMLRIIIINLNYLDYAQEHSKEYFLTSMKNFFVENQTERKVLFINYHPSSLIGKDFEGHFSPVTAYSEETGKMIDEEVRLLVAKAYNKVKALLTDKMEYVTVISEELLKKEVLFKDDLERLIGKRTYEDAIAAEDMPIDPPLI